MKGGKYWGIVGEDGMWRELSDYGIVHDCFVDPIDASFWNSKEEAKRELRAIDSSTLMLASFGVIESHGLPARTGSSV